jgi:hypothetical protein
MCPQCVQGCQLCVSHLQTSNCLVPRIVPRIVQIVWFQEVLWEGYGLLANIHVTPVHVPTAHPSAACAHVKGSMSSMCHASKHFEPPSWSKSRGELNIEPPEPEIGGEIEETLL